MTSLLRTIQLPQPKDDQVAYLRKIAASMRRPQCTCSIIGGGKRPLVDINCPVHGQSRKEC